MADIFLNYSRSDRKIAERISNFIESRGQSLFWDSRIPAGATFTEVIQNALAEAKCVITIWSQESVNSNWVQAEADYALKHNKLLPIAIGHDIDIPFSFRAIQTEFLDINDIQNDEWLEKLYFSAQQFLRDSYKKETRSPSKTQRKSTAGALGEDPKSADRDISDTRKKAFISYADEDEEIAINLVEHLESSGCPCWISFRDVDPGDDYRASITQAMDKISFLVLIYSEPVNKSFDIATELILARKRQKKRFVLKTDNTEPAGPVEYELATVQWIDCQANRQAAFEKIAQRAKLF
jgi:hypothetical protein